MKVMTYADALTRLSGSDVAGAIQRKPTLRPAIMIAIESIGKQIKTAPVDDGNLRTFIPEYKCPRCGESVILKYDGGRVVVKLPACKCGQRILWEER